MTPNLGKMVGRESFMNNISSRLGRQQPLSVAPPHPLSGVPEHYKSIQTTQDEKVKLFAHNWTTLTGKILIVKEAEVKMAVRHYLREIISELQVTKAARWDHEQLNTLELDEWLLGEGIESVLWKETEDQKQKEKNQMDHDRSGETASHSNWSQRSKLLKAVEQCDIGIVWPDYVIANTSTLILSAQGGKGRSVSLLPPALLAIFRADQLVTRMGEALEKVNEAYPGAGEIPSSINMITGPSRSADIENDLTIGIHGPGKVYALIIES